MELKNTIFELLSIVLLLFIHIIKKKAVEKRTDPVALPSVQP